MKPAKLSRQNSDMARFTCDLSYMLFYYNIKGPVYLCRWLGRDLFSFWQKCFRVKLMTCLFALHEPK